MFRKMKVWCVSAMLMAGVVSPVYAEQTPQPIDVYYAPMQFVFDQDVQAPPEGQRGFIYEGSTYVPLRFIAYSLKQAVKWDGDTYTVSLEEPRETDLLEINEYNMNRKVYGGVSDQKQDTSNLQPSRIQVYKEQIHYLFNGVSKETSEDLPGFIYEDSLYVPMRFLSESLGKKIEWNPETYTVTASEKEAPKAETQDPVTTDQTATGTTTPVTGGGGGGGGRGGSSSGGSTSTSNQQAEKDAETKLYALESSCRAKLQPLADQLLNGEQDLGTLMSQGSQIVSQCTSEFNSIINTARDNGVSEARIQAYKDHFDQVQNDAYADLVNQYLNKNK